MSMDMCRAIIYAYKIATRLLQDCYDNACKTRQKSCQLLAPKKSRTKFLRFMPAAKAASMGSQFWQQCFIPERNRVLLPQSSEIGRLFFIYMLMA